MSELDDLDDLDDILDDFDEPEQPKPKPEPEFEEDEFARQLQQGMEELMREMETNPSTRNDFEALVKSMSEATAGPSKDSFSETLSRTVERMQESEAAQAQTETDAFLAEMMKQLDAAGGGDGAGSEAGMAKLLEGMMGQLMSKDILYEPMKDLNEKYPPWLATHKEKLPQKEFENYSNQYGYVQKIMGKFDDPKYDEEDTQTKVDLMDLMQKMQELGPPPKDILSDLAPGMELDSDGLPGAPENCVVM